MIRLSHLIFSLTTICLCSAVFSNALQANPIRTEHTEARLISEVTHLKPGEDIWLMLVLKPEPGWHTYWRNPGDSGKATQITWTLPEQASAGSIQWPQPHRVPSGPLVNFGYKGQIGLPVKLSTTALAAESEQFPIQAKASWLICKDVCIPESAELALTLPVSQSPAGKNPEHTEIFAASRDLLPQEAAWDSEFVRTDKGIVLDIPLTKTQVEHIRNAEFFPHSDGFLKNAAAQKLEKGTDRIRLTFEAGYDDSFEQISGLLAVEYHDNSARKAFTFTSSQSTQPPAALTPLAGTRISIGTLLQTLLFAFLGGIILNLMPCVFPVLSLKALSIVEKARHDKITVRRQGFAFTAGVLFSFLIIALMLLILRMLGAQIGWGFQLQSPIFVMVLAYILFMVGLNLSGVFNFGTRLMGVGQGLTDKGGLTGAFFTGTLATVVATPCSAPFMASAIGIAITQPTAISLLIFLTLGFGLAFPFLMISITPNLHALLPKPGAWMDIMKQLFAFPMYASAVWLVWVLGRQTGIDSVAAALSGMLLLAIAAWLYESSRHQKNWLRGLALATLTLCVAGSLLLTAIPKNAAAISQQNSGENSGEAIQQNAAGLSWEPYSEALLQTHRSAGRPVFINLTADWCITCMVNERVALSSESVANAFNEHNIAYLKGDWTNKDPVITETLARFGRSGVPLYVLFYPENDPREPQVLPQILTEGIVLRALTDTQTTRLTNAINTQD